ncbi:leucine-rich repeat extensin-like protein 1 [Drosophila miranda]|uniref:leucine-rich repeat extensin-like protein 1 n=1 Tax=Drosophila miranda TaxID=7229 RepID=UPI0007E82059|nr:leucine-rich repeat extensin-like protein 1 [Drosophila miranda]
MYGRCSLLFVVLLCASGLAHAHFPEYCAECEQEVWEQVPCSHVPTTARPTTARPDSGTTARPPTTTTTVASTTQVSYPTTSGASAEEITTQPTAYKKCYCECKLGCKEFCRKVATSGPKQQLTQISSTGDYAPGGQIEYTHVHQRKYFPKYGGGAGYAGLVGPVDGPKAYKPYPLVYSEQAAAASSPAANNINAPNYTLEELAQLLSTAYGGKKEYPAPPPPRPQPRAQLQPAPPSVYYSPVYKQQSAGPSIPLVSRVEPTPKRYPSIKVSAAAVASSSGVAVAKVKTPYEEKIAVATPPPSNIYDRTTSYPIVEEHTAYALPQTESYPIAPSQTESYPSITEAYSRQTESYPSQTESYPSRSEEHPLQEPEPNKPSSSFDLAIDNYLKDFGYGNQGRGYADY